MKLFSNKKITKYLSVIICIAICIGIMPKNIIQNDSAYAQSSIEELEQKKEKNNKAIAELEELLKDIEDNADKEEEYQEQLQKKIDLQNENISILIDEIEDIDSKIKQKTLDISNMQSDIERQQIKIEDGLEHFKQRIRAMYITGNDSLASVLTGTNDFYDMLSKLELLSRVAEHDDKLIDNLVADLNSYNDNLQNLNLQKQELEEELAKLEDSRQEMRSVMQELQEDYNKTQEVIDELNKQKEEIENEKANKISENEAYEAQQDEIREAIAEAERKLAQQKNNSNSSSSSSSYNGILLWPVPGFQWISSYYGPRWGRFHYGIDIAGGGISGAPIVASESGTVILVVDGYTDNYGKNYSGNGYGNYVLISHGNSISTLYGHCASIIVSEGDYVERGQTIAYVGSTGFSTGFHLHFEVRVNGERVNPENYLY